MSSYWPSVVLPGRARVFDLPKPEDPNRPAVPVGDFLSGRREHLKQLDVKLFFRDYDFVESDRDRSTAKPAYEDCVY